jgi:hypothetical protein
MLQVHTLDRWAGCRRAVVGYSALPLFLDPRSREQPPSRNLRDYVLNLVWVRERVGAHGKHRSVHFWLQAAIEWTAIACVWVVGAWGAGGGGRVAW